MPTPRLYILCGLPFAGKTTLAGVLSDHLGLARLALDDIICEWGVGLDGRPIPAEHWAAAYNEAYRRLDALLRAGRSVVYDATNYRRAHRRRLERIAARHGATTQVIYLDVAEAEARRRWQQNRVTRERWDVRAEDFAKVVDHFEPPDPDEGVLHYDPAVPPAQWIAQTFGLGLEES
jgi:predicted kinase